MGPGEEGPLGRAPERPIGVSLITAQHHLPPGGPQRSPPASVSSPLHLAALLPLTLGPLPCRLSWNLLGDEAAAELARVLPRMGRLKRVEYEGHSLGGRGRGRGRRGPRGTYVLGKTGRPLGQDPAFQGALLDLHTQVRSRPLPSLVVPGSQSSCTAVC